MKEFEQLIGKTILGILINTTKDRLIFEVGKKYSGESQDTLIYTAVGDCCSKSWFEHFEGVQGLVGNKVLSIETIEMANVLDNSDNFQLIQAYGYKINTDKISAKIEMRNESNGYYGGEVECGWRDQYGSFDSKDEPQSFTVLEKDF